MKVLVTGAGGYIGSRIARYLAVSGFQVFAGIRNNTNMVGELRDVGAHIVVINHREDLKLSCDAVVHCAAAAGAWNSEEAIYQDNFLGMAHIVEFAARQKAKFIFTSSTSIYGTVNVPVLEIGTPSTNLDYYGRSKYWGEQFLAAYSSMSSLSLRLPGVVGGNPQSRNWLPSVVRRLKAREVISAFNLAAPFNNAVYVSDLADFVARALVHEWKGSETLLLGAEGILSVSRVIERLANGLDVKAQIEEIPPLNPPFILSSERAMYKWGYAPMEIGSMLDRLAKENRE